MKKERIQEIIKKTEGLYTQFLSSVIEILGLTFDNL